MRSLFYGNLAMIDSGLKVKTPPALPDTSITLARDWFPGSRRIFDRPEIDSACVKQRGERRLYECPGLMHCWENIRGPFEVGGKKMFPGCWFFADDVTNARGIPAAGIGGCLFRLPVYSQGVIPYTRGCWLFYCRRRASEGLSSVATKAIYNL